MFCLFSTIIFLMSSCVSVLLYTVFLSDNSISGHCFDLLAAALDAELQQHVESLLQDALR